MGRSRYKVYENQLPYFLTCTVVNWLSAFINPSIAQIILESLSFLQNEKRLTLYAYVIMDNHLHLIAAADDLEKEIAHFKSYTAREIIDLLKATGQRALLGQLKWHTREHKRDRRYQFWQEGSHPKLIQGELCSVKNLIIFTTTR